MKDEKLTNQEIAEWHIRRNKQLIAGRKYIKKPKFVGGRLTPPKYEKGEKIEFDPGNMWHLQAALDDQPLSSKLTINPNPKPSQTRSWTQLSPTRIQPRTRVQTNPDWLKIN